MAKSDGRIIAHLGLCPSAFVGPRVRGGRAPTFHMIDWLGSVAHPGVGSALMKHVHDRTPTQYAFGTTAAARRSFDRAGYERIGDIPVFRKVLRAGYRLRSSSRPSLKALAATARDASRMVTRKVRRPGAKVELRRVPEFSDAVREVNDALARCSTLTERTPQRLNHLLRHPSGTLEGYELREGGRILGFALLNRVPEGRAHVGRIVECCLACDEPEAWISAIAAVVAVFAGRGVDAVVGCAGLPILADAYRACGFGEAFALETRLRDPANLLPRSGPFHLTFLEADYSYLP